MEKKQQWVVTSGAVVLSNILGLLSLRGPMEMSFSLSALPIFLISLTMGWEAGYAVGVLGGITQALQYGSFWYIFYTGILGAVSGHFAKNHKLNRKWGGVLFSVGVFFMFWWIILANQSRLISESLVILTALLAFTAIEYTLIKKHLTHNPLLNLTLAGCAGAAAYIPYDLLVMGVAQGYNALQGFVVLSKDLIQDYLAAIAAAVILQHKSARKLLNLK